MYDKRVFSFAIIVVIFCIFVGCQKEISITIDLNDVNSIPHEQEATIGKLSLEEQQVLSEPSPFSSPQSTDIQENNISEEKVLNNIDYESRIFADFEQICDIVNKNVGVGSRVTDSSINLSKKYEVANDYIVLVVGYTLENNYYAAEVIGYIIEQEIDWQYKVSHLIVEDVEFLVDNAIECFFQSDELEGNILESRVVSSYFDGMDDTGYLVSIDYKFKVKDGSHVEVAGSIGPETEEGWYDGFGIIKMKLVEGTYEFERMLSGP